jgi:Cu/Ag efflux protein CusF
MRNTKWLLVAIALIASAVPWHVSAQTQKNGQDSTKSENQKVQRYKLTGTVKSVDAKNHKLIVDGKDIPGFMAAMTMPYNTGKDEDLSKISAGDQIQADVVVGDGETHLDKIKVTGQAKDRAKQ